MNKCFCHFNGYEVKDAKARPVNNTDTMKSMDLVAGNVIKTLGYYTPSDGGSGTYLIRTKLDTDIEDLGSIHFIGNDLVAELIIENNTVSVLQFGAKADNTTNNRVYFENAFKVAKNIIFPNKNLPYLVDYFNIPEGKNVIGVNKTQINTNRTSSQPYSKINSNSNMKDIYIKSLNEDLEWNRFSLEGVNNITIENCKFEGFRHNSDTPNGWGNLISNCSNIRIINCEYENNSQSDIAFVNEVNNVVIENCKGSRLDINFEPDVNYKIKNVIIKDCSDIEELYIQDNTLKYYGISDVTIQNCIINNFYYKGGDISLINTKIKSLEQLILSNATFGGIINNVCSFGFDEQLNDDPLLIHCTLRDNTDLEKCKNYWNTGYTALERPFNRNEDISKGKILEINKNHSSGYAYLFKDFIVEPNETYGIRCFMNTVSSDTLNYAGYNMQYDIYNSDNEIIQTINVAQDRNDINLESKWCEKIVFVKIPENGTKLRLKIGNCHLDKGSKTSANYKYVLLNKLNLNKTTNDDVIKSYSDTKPLTSVSYNDMCLKNDILYAKNPVDIGAYGYICTVAGNPGTWKKFGLIETE